MKLLYWIGSWVRGWIAEERDLIAEERSRIAQKKYDMSKRDYLFEVVTDGQYKKALDMVGKNDDWLINQDLETYFASILERCFYLKGIYLNYLGDEERSARNQLIKEFAEKIPLEILIKDQGATRVLINLLVDKKYDVALLLMSREGFVIDSPHDSSSGPIHERACAVDSFFKYV